MEPGLTQSNQRGPPLDSNLHDIGEDEDEPFQDDEGKTYADMQAESEIASRYEETSSDVERPLSESPYRKRIRLENIL